MKQPLPAVLASGAWLKNTACLLDHGQVRWSALHGDLQDPAACRQLEASLRALARGARAPVAAVAHDLHPDFYSTRIAVALADEWGVPAIAVQHHHAHIAAVMAEHGLDEPVIGLALDGVGLGTDGTAWGGELLRVSGHGWERLGSLWPLALPGGDAAAREPWRMAASALHALGAGDRIAARFSPDVGPGLAAGVQRMLATGLNCPTTSSAGRWFDAAAGALGLCIRQAHEAEAAMALEAAAARWLARHEIVETAIWPDTPTCGISIFVRCSRSCSPGPSRSAMPTRPPPGSTSCWRRAWPAGPPPRHARPDAAPSASAAAASSMQSCAAA